MKKNGFTLLEVLISIAIIGGLLYTVIYTITNHLAILERHKTITVAVMLAREKYYTIMGSVMTESKGHFEEPYGAFRYDIKETGASIEGTSVVEVIVQGEGEEVTIKGYKRRGISNYNGDEE